MFQKGSTFYKTITNVSKIAKMQEFLKIKVAKKYLKHNFFKLLGKKNKKSVSSKT